MKLVEALRALQKIPADASPFVVSVVCGMTPLHLQTFLAAHLQIAFGPSRRVTIKTGLYGDLMGNLERLDNSSSDAIVVALEWSDLDPRLGIRHLGGWGLNALADVEATINAQCSRLERSIALVSEHSPIVISLPTLPLPPLFYQPGAQMGANETAIRARIGQLAAVVSRLPGVKLVNSQTLDRLSPPAHRFDVKSDLTNGFPYLMIHADALGDLLAKLVVPPAPKKGLITDLDDTVWQGILGDVGADGVSWDLDHHSQMHGLYQQMLRSLSEAGVLIAVASKNNPANVDEVFRRDELASLRTCLFPMEVSWGPKSLAVGRILKAWNVGADSVVFIDDSPMELAEVKAAYPDVECLLFPRSNDAEIYNLIVDLRDRFGKGRVSEEDALRLESLRRPLAFDADNESSAVASEGFLEQADAEMTFDYASLTSPPPRALELVNKTNQFNLNGQRFTDGEWLTFLRRPGAFLIAVNYKDKYGPLGTIAVIAGVKQENHVLVTSWVLSCRAFSRRIEDQILEQLFRHFGVDRLTLNYANTPRNGPLREYLATLIGSEPTPMLDLSREVFSERSPTLHHRIIVNSHE